MANAHLSLLLSAVQSCQELWELLKAVGSFKIWCQLWQLLQTVGRLDGCYKLSAALTDVASCQQLWKLLQVVDSFYSCYKLSVVLTALTSRWQLWKLLQAVISVVTSCWQLWQLSHGVNSCETETSCQQLSLHKQALDTWTALTTMTAFVSS